MGAVDISIGHDDDLVIAQFFVIDLVAANAGAERRDQGSDLFRGQHLVKTGALHIEDLTPERQDGLVFAMAPLLGRAAGRVTLDDEELGLGRVLFLAIRQLAGQGSDIQCRLAPGQLARLARGFAGRRSLDDLADHHLGFVGVLLEPLGQRLSDRAFNSGTDFGRDQLVLGLGREFRIGDLDRQDTGQAFTGIIAGNRDLGLGGQAGRRRIGIDDAGQGTAETGQVGAAIALRDVVGEAEDILVIAVIPLQRRFHRHAVLFALDQDGRREDRCLVAIEMGDKGGHAALIDHGV